MPEYYKRTHFNRYLRKRGFTEEDYDFFPVGTTRNMNFKFDDYDNECFYDRARTLNISKVA